MEQTRKKVVTLVNNICDVPISREAFSQTEPYAKLASASRILSSADFKNLVADAQYELTAAWKFCMALGTDKRVLVVVNGFTSFPLSLARHCAHVTVCGLNDAEKTFLQDLAVSKSIHNYGWGDDLRQLDTLFHLIVVTVTGAKLASGFPSAAQVRALLHPLGELWIIATNVYSVRRIKGLIRSFENGLRPSDGDSVLHGRLGIRLQFGMRHSLPSGKVKQYMQKVGCEPFIEVGLIPTVVRLHAVEAVGRQRGGVWYDGQDALQKGRKASEIVVGAVCGELQESFLSRLLKRLPDTELTQGVLQSYRVSPGGKVLLFAHFQRGHEQCNTVIKLPLNEYTQKRLAIDQGFLKFLASTQHIRDTHRTYFPGALSEGHFEGQPFFVESMMAGRSWDTVHLPEAQQQCLIREIFVFWRSIQRSGVQPYFFDQYAFEEFIEEPLRRLFTCLDRRRDSTVKMGRILAYLRSRFMHKEHLLSLVHGDFQMKNIMLDGSASEFVGVIDWDRGQEQAFPIIDVLHFFVRRQKESYSQPALYVLLRMLNTKKDYGDFWAILKTYIDDFCIDEDIILDFSIIYWIQQTSGIIGSYKILDKPYMKKHFYDPLELLMKHVLQT